MTHSIKFAFLIFISVSYLESAAQGGIGNEEITITKEREVVLQKANRIYDKIQVLESEKSSKKIIYTFFDRKPTGIEQGNYQPNIVDPKTQTKDNLQTDGFYNYLKLGGGNYGRLFGELHTNSFQNDKLLFGVYALHNSAKRGPVEGENSGNSDNKIELDGKYHGNTFELSAKAGYERNNYYFYGYDTTQFKDFFEKNEIRQLINKFSFNVGFENTNPEAVIDYQLNTNLKTLSDYLSAEETDWATNLTIRIPLIKDRITAKIASDAFISQRTDNDIQRIQKRNLFRIHPSFNFNYNQIGVNVGFKAINETDIINSVDVTYGYPTAEIIYKTPNLMYFSIGYDGDVIRNTLGNFLLENPFLRSQVPLQNTRKDNEIYLSAKGNTLGGLGFSTKLSYGNFTNLSFFSVYDGNPRFELRKFDILYENQTIPYFIGNLQLNYQPNVSVRSNLNFNYYYYGVKSFEKPFHRPTVDMTFTNSFVISNRFVASVDMFLLSGIYAQNPFNFNEVSKLPTITDINTKFDYLLNEQFSVFVQLNNLLGNNYQRFLFYPKQGLNFLVGLNLSI